ncbi:MAG TPA: C40 family peptidase [Chitinophagaceae bacterium]|nr:C40 family peptidase [Chitinophagaceae bacterium]HNF28780.1 C40 family peptidase [Chitinophagaceae bacterium]HNN30561.1 C40 family peptidase [Chitinophagaceae bacterium]
MNYACTIVPVAPLRSEALHSSEMVSQLLFGECVTILDSTKDFFKVSSMYDDYIGWCSKKQLTTVNENFSIQNHKQCTNIPITTALYKESNLYLSSGSFIGALKNNILTINDKIFNIHFNSTETNIQKVIHSYLNTPYLWGGKSIFGIDCSGFTQQVYKILGTKIYRDAYEQAQQGKVIGFLQEAAIGDLAFFDNENGKITHVGILLNDHEIIHASGIVRIDLIDNEGIINSETKERTHHLRLIKRIF